MVKIKLKKTNKTPKETELETIKEASLVHE